MFVFEMNIQLGTVDRHKVPKSIAPCVEYYNAGVPTVTCRMELKHLGGSVTILGTRINTGKKGEQNSVANIYKENGLLQCCTELVSLTFNCTSPKAAEKYLQDYATGYLPNFTEERFSQISDTKRILYTNLQRGSYQNQDCGNGLLKWKGEMLKCNQVYHAV